MNDFENIRVPTNELDLNTNFRFAVNTSHLRLVTRLDWNLNLVIELENSWSERCWQFHYLSWSCSEVNYKLYKLTEVEGLKDQFQVKFNLIKYLISHYINFVILFKLVLGQSLILQPWKNCAFTGFVKTRKNILASILSKFQKMNDHNSLSCTGRENLI